MNALLANAREMLSLVLWLGMILLGGFWVVKASFNLSSREQLLSGLALGLVIETWLANLLSRLLPASVSFWVAALAVLLLGLSFSFPMSKSKILEMLRLPIYPAQWAGLLGLSLLLFLVGRGLGILDDYQSLPTVSLMAAGDIPPHFALDPSVAFNYHYTTFLLTAQVVRLTDQFVWVALDAVRSFGFALGLLLGFLYVKRITRSAMAGMVAVLFTMFNGGARWMLVFLPAGLLEKISTQIRLIGSAASSAPDLISGLAGPWQVETGAPLLTPFAFGSGLNTATIWTFHAGESAVSGLTAGLLLLTHNRWNSWRAYVVTVILLSSLAIASELSAVTLGVAILLLAIIQAFKTRSLKIEPSLRRWIVVFGVTGVFAAFQGGVITGAVNGILGRLLGAAAGESYFTGGFRFIFPPVLLSTHLGYLSLANPYQALAALFEIGPQIIFLPLVLIYGWKTYRWKRWWESALFLVAILSVIFSFLDYTGSAGPTAIARIQGGLVGLPSAWAVPVVWLWARNRSDMLKAWVAGLITISIFGGVFLFGYEVIAAARPNPGTYLNLLDARLTRQYWNRLEPDALVFDPIAWRGVTVLGRPTNSHQTWYTSKPAWNTLVQHPDPISVSQYGFDYAYFGRDSFEGMPADVIKAWENNTCVIQMAYLEQEFPPDSRVLYDIRNCR